MIEEGKRKKYLTQFDQRAPIIGLPTQREICRRIALGEEIQKIVEDENLPSRQEIYDLIWREPDFGKMYKNARIARCEIWAEEMRETAKKAAALDGVAEKKANAHVQAIRLQIETEKWLLSKWLPAGYADELPTDGQQKSVEGILEIIKMVTGMARTPIQAKVIDVPMIGSGATDEVEDEIPSPGQGVDEASLSEKDGSFSDKQSEKLDKPETINNTSISMEFNDKKG